MLPHQLRRLREKKEISQRELAKLAKTSSAYVCSLEGGLRKRPGGAVLQRLAAALGVSIQELCSEKRRGAA
jgi:transcriptional regulator with XRE-family HTH domain